MQRTDNNEEHLHSNSRNNHLSLSVSSCLHLLHEKKKLKKTQQKKKRVCVCCSSDNSQLTQQKSESQ